MLTEAVADESWRCPASQTAPIATGRHNRISRRFTASGYEALRHRARTHATVAGSDQVWALAASRNAGRSPPPCSSTEAPDTYEASGEAR